MSTVKNWDGLPVHMEAKVSLGMGPREDVSYDTQHRTDQEKLAAVRQRIRQKSARVSPPPLHALCCHCDMQYFLKSTLCNVVVIATLMWGALCFPYREHKH